MREIRDKHILGDSFVIHCQIHKLETKYDWIYDGCPKCGSKVKSDDPSWICPLCKKQPEPKMKLHYLVRDKTGSTSVIFWDKLAVQLVKKTASELKCLVKEDEDDIADELDLPVGKNLLLKLKMNDFNKKHPTSSISVVQYTICEDLLDQFSEASTEAIVESVDAESVTPLVTTLDQSTISDLSQHVTPAPIKGKRRITNKRKGDKDDLTTTSHAFRAGGGNFGDDVCIPIPHWVAEIGRSNPDIFFTDREGRHNPECLSWGIDKERVLRGRTALKVYFDFMRSFRVEFDEYFEDGIISLIEVGLGPCGELRYPSFLVKHGWRYPVLVNSVIIFFVVL
ncbi:hypothetical protein K1719_020776 [Acacia pycnantha]|nr:hypothetical protein K1719_020776 [Acacia pycnantha]